jgi:polyisoprenoid-binding protein YceI
MKNTRIALLGSLVALAAISSAESKTFKVVTEGLEYRNLATIENESDFEAFTGKTNKVTGTITFDPTKKKGQGTISVDVASIDTGIALRNDHMKSEGWLDAAKYPSITFTTTSAKNVGGDKYKVNGTLTLHGVTKPVTAVVTLRYRAQGDATKAAGFDGDVVQISSKFVIKLTDYGIKLPPMVSGKVSNEVTLGVSAYAVAK